MVDKLPRPNLEPLYTIPEAASYLAVPESTFRSWVRGRKGQAGRPVLTSEVPGPTGAPTIPFVCLAEGMVLAAIRKAGVPLQRIRPALDALRDEIGIEQALASKRLYTDGAELIYNYGRQHGESADILNDLVVVRNGQRMFNQIVGDYLQRVTYGSDGYVSLIRLPEFADTQVDVVADPTRSFGRPIFAKGGAKVEDVLGRIHAGEEFDAVADDFGVSVHDIQEALRATSTIAA